MTTRKLVICITFLAIFVMAARVTMDTDTWWHLRAGQWIVEHRQVPQTDPFSYTRFGETWQYPGWLVEAPMYWLYQALGPAGLNLWAALFVTLTFAFIWPTLTGNPFLKAFTLVIAAVTSGIYWAARPYLITFLLAGVFFWVLEDYRWQRANRLWLLPVLMVIWANSHGGFATGFILWGVYLVGRVETLNLRRMRIADLWEFLKRQGPLLLVGLTMILAVCINPSGPVMLLYQFKTISIGTLRDYIQEWQSPNFHYLNVQPFAWLLLATLGAVGFSRRRLALTDFMLAAGFALMGLLAGRNIPFFALTAPMVLTRHADPALRAFSRYLGVHVTFTLDSTPRPQRVINGILLVVLIAAVALKVGTVLPLEANWSKFAETLPVKAVENLKADPPDGRLFSSYNWGGYLLWALPEYPVFVDGRTDLYNDEIINQWITVIRGEEGWQEVLDRWGVEVIMLEPNREVIKLLTDNGWEQRYEDDVAVIFVRR